LRRCSPFVFALGIVCFARSSQAAPTAYTDRAAFVETFPGLTSEGFEQALATFAGCPSPLSHDTPTNACFTAGALMSGFAVRSSTDRPSDGLVVGSGGPTGNFLCASYYADDTEILLPSTPKVIAFDVVNVKNGSTSTVTAYDEANQLVDTRAVAHGAFYGLRSDVPLSRIRIGSVGIDNDGVDNLSFGTPALVGIAPASGGFGGKTSVTLSGIALSSKATVSFGGVTATTVAGGGTSITCEAPAHAAGAVDVVVTSGGVTFTLPAAYTYRSVAATLALAASSPAPYYAGESIAFDVSATGEAPSGDVEIREGTAALGKKALDAESKAQFGLTLSAGDHTLTAHYAGDALHPEGASSAVVVHVETRPVDAGASDSGANDSGAKPPATPDAGSAASVPDAGAANAAGGSSDGCSMSDGPLPVGGALGALLAVLALLARRFRVKALT